MFLKGKRDERDIACMRKIRNAYEIWAETLKRKGLDRKLIPILVIEK
jgi:hypothetical protein